jgi:hypothetical protein
MVDMLKEAAKEQSKWLKAYKETRDLVKKANRIVSNEQRVQEQVHNLEDQVQNSYAENETLTT